MIGLFDSGVGGLSVFRETVKLLPHVETLYVSDNANCPYGPQPSEKVIERSLTITRALMRQGCTLIVVACNTATAAAIDILRRTYPDYPFVGMEPAVKPAVLASKRHRVGVLATAGTLRGRLFRETSRRFADRAKMEVCEVKGWVEAVESGKIHSTPETRELVRSQIQPLLDASVDSLVLGCTHFPFLREIIAEIAGPGIALYDPAPAVARRVQSLLPPSSGPDLFPPPHHFWSTGSTAPLENFLTAVLKDHFPADIRQIEL